MLLPDAPEADRGLGYTAGRYSDMWANVMARSISADGGRPRMISTIAYG